MKLKSLIKSTSDWFSSTPERALNRAYKSALKIQEIETKHFRGQKVSRENADYGASVITYFETEVQSYLQKINMELTVFKASRLFLSLSNLQDTENNLGTGKVKSEQETTAIIIFDKLKFIDEVIAKYKSNAIEKNVSNNVAIIAASERNPEVTNSAPSGKKSTKVKDQGVKNKTINFESASQKTGVLPRSFMNTLNKIKQEIDPKSGESEEQVLTKYRKSRYRTALSIKFILLLIIIPLLIHQLTKTFFLIPVVEQYFSRHEQVIFINRDLEDEALEELQHYEETLHFRGLIGLGPELSPEKIEQEVKQKAGEITEEYRRHGIDSIANIFADLFSFIAFVLVLVNSKKEIEVVKSFLDEILYGLSDPAKAFLIILFTDMFVGFHSPHGWEVILEGVAHHFGLPENREFNFLFIATFPVILDTVLKYWIFRYLNRISPSAVATYKNMNE
ncbi:CemA family protein [Rippkaea orientalis PCC 8801]|uniref:Proton extrusion protein PxcA n=1 Tax=Rippkaea orientalis (strain PCC 8801 / RF-1) TaxID=41431 RepID=PXCA_RIPO1|nr:proton extrusion protein PcxA [Rippkaea orientalis]B7K2V6.1 RecName: Full=Proton extrusion protein PxcA [Rippkaea orientalis PCC 8801]ACK67657.1 CemA family protein [Rippkaea orientalis PCC 8801]